MHWLIWNIPGEATSLPEGLPNEASLGLIGGRPGTTTTARSAGSGPRRRGPGVHHIHPDLRPGRAVPFDERRPADLVNAQATRVRRPIVTYEAAGA